MENKIAIPNKEAQIKLLAEVDLFLKQNNIDKITTPEQKIRAGECLRVIQARKQATEKKEKEFTKPLNDLKTQWKNFFKPALDKLAVARREIERRMDDYDIAEERERQRKQRALQAFYIKQAEKEKKESEKLIQKLEKVGDLEGVEYEKEKLAQQVSVPAPVLMETPTKVAGVHQRVTIKWRIKDEKDIPDEYFKRVLDLAKIQSTVDSLGLTANIAGIEVYEDRGRVVRAAVGELE